MSNKNQFILKNLQKIFIFFRFIVNNYVSPLKYMFAPRNKMNAPFRGYDRGADRAFFIDRSSALCYH